MSPTDSASRIPPLISGAALVAPRRRMIAFLVTAFVGMLVYILLLNTLGSTGTWTAIVDVLAPVFGLGGAQTLIGVALLGLFVVLALVSARLVSRLRIRDIALRRAPLVATLLSYVLAWPLYMLFYWIATALIGTARVDPAWMDASVVDRVGIALNPVLVNAFPEEVVYRAVILGISFELLRRRLPTGLALGAALLISTVIFGLSHVPAALFTGQSVVVAAVAFLPAGLAFALLYLITRNIDLVGVVHGLGNGSSDSLASIMPVVPDGVPYEPLLFAAAFAAAVPLWIARRRRRSLAESDGAPAPADPAEAR